MSEINNIPKHWEVKRLGEVGEIVSGGTPSTKVSEYWKGNISWISPADLSGYNQKYISNGRKSISEVGLKHSSARLIPKGAVLFSSRAPIGYTVIAGKEVCTNQGFKSVVPNKSLSSEYLFYYLKASKQKAEKAASGTTFKEISLKAFSQLEIPLPPLPEQHAIVARIEELLSDLDNGKQQLLTAQQQLKIYRQSLLKWAFEGKLTKAWRKKQSSLQTSVQLLKKIKSEREDILTSNKIKIKPIQTISEEEIKELPKLPNGAVWVKLGEILWSVKDGPHYSPKYQEQGIPFISGGNIRPNGIDFKNVKYISQELHDELSIRCKPMKMDVLYTKGGTTGIAKVNDYDIDFNVWVHVAVLKTIPSINPYYLQFALNSNHCYKQSQKYTHGVGNQDLGLTRMILITLPICSIEEQNYIVSELESKLTVCDKIAETISQSLLQAETLRQSILKRAFEGKLVNFEPSTTH